jgi:hypothetical protein
MSWLVGMHHGASDSATLGGDAGGSTLGIVAARMHHGASDSATLGGDAGGSTLGVVGARRRGGALAPGAPLGALPDG